MPPKKKPSTPVEVYKAIIDQLVEESSGVSEALVRKEGIFSRSLNAKAQNAFVQSLTAEQRDLLAAMLRDQRVGGIGAVLATLHWWMTCRDVGLTLRGKPMPVDLSGEGLHGDYIGRLGDWQWPDDARGASKA